MSAEYPEHSPLPPSGHEQALDIGAFVRNAIDARQAQEQGPDQVLPTEPGTVRVTAQQLARGVLGVDRPVRVSLQRVGDHVVGVTFPEQWDAAITAQRELRERALADEESQNGDGASLVPAAPSSFPRWHSPRRRRSQLQAAQQAATSVVSAVSSVADAVGRVVEYVTPVVGFEGDDGWRPQGPLMPEGTRRVVRGLFITSGFLGLVGAGYVGIHALTEGGDGAAHAVSPEHQVTTSAPHRPTVSPSPRPAVTHTRRVHAQARPNVTTIRCKPNPIGKMEWYCGSDSDQWVADFGGRGDYHLYGPNQYDYTDVVAGQTAHVDGHVVTLHDHERNDEVVSLTMSIQG